MPTKPTQSEYDGVAALRVALRRFLHESDRITRAHGLTPQRYDLLALIQGSTSTSPSIKELAELLSLAPHSVTELVDRAEDAGLVRRVEDNRDRRVARIALTREGKARFDAALIALRPERRLLLGLLRHVYAQAESLQTAEATRPKRSTAKPR
jgi:DNA-binding MarR family transcriptional regulator